MNIIIRADASIDIGTGHIMRCLTLANFLKEKGAEVKFICTEVQGDLVNHIRHGGYEVYTFPECRDILSDAENTINILQDLKVDLLIVDHYQIDSVWERILKESFGHMKIMVIDDLANRQHHCDLLLDQNYFKDFENRYDHLVSKECTKLLGPRKILLRPEFYHVSKKEDNNHSIQDILVFYGGSDPTNETLKVLDALDAIDLSSITIHVVVGSSNSNKERIKNICADKNINFYVQINYLAQLMAKADLSLGAGGVTMWERCFLGLPSIVTVVADNQKESTEAAADYGAVWNLGWHESVNVSDLVDIIERAIEHPEELKDMSIKAKQLMQSEFQNETHPVVDVILEVLS
ncbi:UDP-2,4-diacetamido-2,4,6-trideoxy-beta-L-altropyranose hydrolase [Bacillus sp. FJAT-29790]|uniref:UDP-2,4-diacetamido-2,4, 6-trideoxy-beta-L-altropyranose hydrolase n=1 Tax=Bacillus sp. FJAT-29790 TaxID=1895002 RepID=UPI001C2246AC|nr:UDP-2,4-diacetamido-2,4,6-trideoxy-beta-L-altropyranose hydrolase [Bacillus sp. FJAT-29790]MBU8881197.1 UDP-2,4-diacetamido-2,4,6-trideoxy-beta-L-altropyranose hydrolase [Bacillus sp. FJAT-29790]